MENNLLKSNDGQIYDLKLFYKPNIHENEDCILCLSNLKLISIPNISCDYININYLQLDGNNLTKLPDNIGNLSYLKKLNLNFNKLKKLPDTIGNLTNLRNLFLSNNKLKKLPDNIGNLNKLFNLKLNGNQLKKLPDTFGNLTSLYILNLGFNNLVELSDTIGNLNNLGYLILFNNKISLLSLSLLPLFSISKINYCVITTNNHTYSQNLHYKNKIIILNRYFKNIKKPYGCIVTN
jgi:leucine-rich repeat protein SHOC2